MGREEEVEIAACGSRGGKKLATTASTLLPTGNSLAFFSFLYLKKIKI